MWSNIDCELIGIGNWQEDFGASLSPQPLSDGQRWESPLRASANHFCRFKWTPSIDFDTVNDNWFSGTCQKMDWWGKNARSPPRRLRRYWKGNPFAIEIGQWPRPSRYHVMTFQSARLNVVIQELSTYYGFSSADPKSLAFRLRGPIDFYVVAIIPDICQ